MHIGGLAAMIRRKARGAVPEKSDFLKEYHKKRDFDLTSEPFGGGKKKRKNIFVIQKHAASHLHYDLRLAVGGVLRSWAVPKGPSIDPKEKRLAMRTEDHPLEYADFEGVIPEGYGAGTVMVWDAGTYRPLNDKGDEKTSFSSALKKGHAKFELNGKKLRGGFSLVRISKRKKERWLLIKSEDDEADARRNPTSTQKKSVLTRRTMNQVRKGKSSPEDKQKK